MRKIVWIATLLSACAEQEQENAVALESDTEFRVVVVVEKLDCNIETGCREMIGCSHVCPAEDDVVCSPDGEVCLCQSVMCDPDR